MQDFAKKTKNLRLEKISDFIDKYLNFTEIVEKLGKVFTFIFGKAKSN